ncbi:MAG: electron transfer flavoprotein subunit beta/FixA family protein [Evtepia sp.]
MNMLVCVKQVPDTTEIKIDPVTNTLIRDGVPSIVNPFDAYALEAAARLKDKIPGSRIVVVAMGPDQAKVALKECLSVGGDKAYLVSDRACGGSDTLATGYILAKAKAKIEELEGLKFDIIYCGKQAIDGDTAQVGPQMAENLDYPQVTYAFEAFAAENGKIRVKKEIEDGFEILEMDAPCVITVTKPDFEPRYATIKSKMAANKAKIDTLNAVDCDLDVNQAGLKGSPTKVKKTFTPPRKTGGLKIKEETNEESAKKLYQLLTDANII